MAKFVNLTPHKIVLATDNGTIEIPPSGTIARVAVSQIIIGDVDSIPLVANQYGDPTGIPDDPENDTIYIVSSLVKSHPSLKGDHRFVAPDTGPTALRDADGRIVAVTRLVAEM